MTLKEATEVANINKNFVIALLKSDAWHTFYQDGKDTSKLVEDISEPEKLESEKWQVLDVSTDKLETICPCDFCDSENTGFCAMEECAYELAAKGCFQPKSK